MKKATRSKSKPLRHEESALKLRFTPRGPDETAINRTIRTLNAHPEVQALLKGTRHRMLSFEIVEPELERKPARPPTPPDRFRATFYDYTHNRTVLAEGSIKRPDNLQVAESGIQPLPSPDEFQEAVETLRRDSPVAADLRANRLIPYPPMPPLLGNELPDGHIERAIAVGLMPAEKGIARHEIVGVNLLNGSVQRFENHAPPNAVAHNPICGQPNSGQTTTNKGTAGQVWVTVTQGSTTLWRFLVVRPAASSGTNGSGVELRFVDYRGKRVLYRPHVPILNVKYNKDACGPYRDWQWEEGMIQATGTDVAPGFRLCSAPATTILDTGSDSGNFLGTAIFVQGLEVVLVSEMQAGWYRYISEWRLHVDGTIRSRFGFSAVSSSCVCNVHHHHVYWRLDFDIETPDNNRVREFNDPPIISGTHWHTKHFELRRPRDPAHQRKWRVENVASGAGYEIIPGSTDGVATAMPDWPFPRGDFWVLRYHGNEIDDGVVHGPPYEAGIDSFLNGEAVDHNDVVIWYGAHFTHDVSSEPPGTFGEIVGPELKPVNW